MDNTIENLKNNHILNCDVLEALRRKTARILYAKNGDFLIYETISGANYMNAETPEIAEHMLTLVESGNLFSIRQKEYSQMIEEKFPVKYHLQCMQAHYDKKEPARIPEIPFEIVRLEKVHIPFLKENYKEVQSEGYIEGRIREGMFGVLDNNQLAGFIGKHDEGSIGLLHIMPAYRRLNLGAALTSFMVNRALELGEIPFSQVTLGNEASLALHEKIGFILSKEYLYWLD